jgi:hypothetical protein
VEWNAMESGNTQAVITDMYGRKISMTLLSGIKGYNQVKLPLSALAKGQYILQLYLTKEVLTAAFSKQ